MRIVDEASAKFEKDEIVFMHVHCRKHFDFCFQRGAPNSELVSAELFYMDEKDKLFTKLFDLDRTVDGIQVFFEREGLIEPELDPVTILARAGSKYLEIV